MSAEGMLRTVLATGLAKVVDKFIDPDLNELPKGSPESHYFMLEAAGQRGFEMIDDDGHVYVCNSRQIVALLSPMTAPIDMILHCPACGTQHIDAEESEEQRAIQAAELGLVHGSRDWESFMEKRWLNEPHRSHLCHHCKHIWRPADVPTNGVGEIKTKGKDDSATALIDNEPVAYLVEGSHDGKLYAKIVQFTVDEARDSASKFARHYSTVTTTPLARITHGVALDDKAQGEKQ